jgi:hemoglobin
MRPSLYEFAGGDSAFLALAQAHHARCLADPELNHPFSHPDQHPQHVERLAAYWAEVLGGPATYSETCGNESHVLTLHCGNGDLGDLPERFHQCFVHALDDAGLPADREFRSGVGGVYALGRRQHHVVLTDRHGGRARPANAALGLGRTAENPLSSNFASGAVV